MAGDHCGIAVLACKEVVSRATSKTKLKATAQGAELATAPSKVFEEWASRGCPLADEKHSPRMVNGEDKPLKPIDYKELNLDAPWDSFDLAHELTTKGIQKFVADYESTLKRSA